MERGTGPTTLLLLLLSHISRVQLCVTAWTAAHQAPRPWDFPGKNTGVGCHFLLQCMKVKSESEVVQSCLTLCDPMDCSLRPTMCDGMDSSPPGSRPWDSPGKSTGVGCHCYSTQGCKRVINNFATKQQRGLLNDVPKPF